MTTQSSQDAPTPITQPIPDKAEIDRWRHVLRNYGEAVTAEKAISWIDSLEARTESAERALAAEKDSKRLIAERAEKIRKELVAEKAKRDEAEKELNGVPKPDLIELGSRLADMLQSDDFNNIEPYLQAANLAIIRAEERAESAERELATAKAALDEIRTFPRKRMPADIANEALGAPLPKGQSNE